ncbi:hypothetical protein ACH3VR_11115 [Microbacterium sp. B2969]|uniref:Integral membrane protein n=1 Tax=Microbacterium alkaliflavum TaxID=3248839 RepID=A0ABW7Q8D0_9MICO
MPTRRDATPPRVDRRAPRAARAVRGVAAASVASLVAATAHTLAGGGAPPPLLVAAVVLLAAPVAVALAGRRLALWRLALTVIASQVLFHLSFAVADGATGRSIGHLHHAELIDLAPAHVAAWPPDPLMIVGHAVATAITIVALYRGERMLRALARGILRLVRHPVEAPHAHFPRSLAPVTVAEPVVRVFLTSEISRRGPPAPRLATA